MSHIFQPTRFEQETPLFVMLLAVFGLQKTLTFTWKIKQKQTKKQK